MRVDRPRCPCLACSNAAHCSRRVGPLSSADVGRGCSLTETTSPPSLKIQRRLLPLAGHRSYSALGTAHAPHTMRAAACVPSVVLVLLARVRGLVIPARAVRRPDLVVRSLSATDGLFRRRAAISKSVADPPVAESLDVVGTLPSSPERWLKATKQLATLGPASSTMEMIEALFLAGVDAHLLRLPESAICVPAFCATVCRW